MDALRVRTAEEQHRQFARVIRHGMRIPDAKLLVGRARLIRIRGRRETQEEGKKKGEHVDSRIVGRPMMIGAWWRGNKVTIWIYPTADAAEHLCAIARFRI
ncbi:MAG: hypothetical protein RhofKO_11420 [Rhodothermales bacterium]